MPKYEFYITHIGVGEAGPYATKLVGAHGPDLLVELLAKLGQPREGIYVLETPEDFSFDNAAHNTAASA